MFRAVIFDWSGTLVDDMAPVLDATNEVLAAYGHGKMDRETFRREFRLPFRGFYEDRLPGVPMAELEELFGRCFRESREAVRVLPGALDFLIFCRDHGARLFVLSSARDEFVTAQALALGLHGFFEKIHAGVIDKRTRLPELLAEHGLGADESAFIGDMEHDIEAARAAGLHGIGVLGGYDPAEKLMRAGPDVVVSGLAALRRILAVGRARYGP